MGPANGLDAGSAQKARLVYLEFLAYFLGWVGRKDLTSRFGIKEAAATRDFSLYNRIAPKNLVYDLTEKAYKPSDMFRPTFKHDALKSLRELENIGLSDLISPDHNYFIERPTRLINPDVHIVATISRAIYNKKVVTIEYHSFSSGFTRRDVVPFAMIDNGLRWHVRAWDRRREQFGDFVLTRIQSAKVKENEQSAPHESALKDQDWGLFVNLELLPHPKLDYTEPVKMDWGMEDGKKVLTVRAVFAGYLLRLWNVDCTKDASMEGNEVHLFLGNRKELEGVNSMYLAPGFNT